MTTSLRARARSYAALALLLFGSAFVPIASAQQVTTTAGGLVGDGLAPSEASLNFSAEVAFDAAGNLYIADVQHHRIRKVTPAGAVSTYAGNGTSGSAGDGGQATQAQLNIPWGLVFDAAGNLYISEKRGNRIRKVTPAGVISTVAGDGTTAILNSPGYLAVATDGTLYVSEQTSHRVKKIVGGVVSVFAGTGSAGNTGDNGPATAAKLNNPYGLLVEPDGSLLIADATNNKIRRVDTAGTITTYRSVSYPYSMTYNSAGLLYVSSDYGIFKDNGAGGFTLVAGDQDGNGGIGPWGYGGDGGPATLALMNFPFDLAFAPDGRLFFSDYGNERVRVISSGNIDTYFGPGRSNDGGAALGARISHPGGVAYDAAGNMYVSERNLHRIRKVTPGGVISTIGGTGIPGETGNGGPATSAQIYEPRGLAVLANGDVLFADYQNIAIRKIDTNGTISQFTGDNLSMQLPDQVAVDGAGNVYFSHRYGIAKVPAGSSVAANFAGNGQTSGLYQEGVQATTATTGTPGQIGFDAAGNVYFADRNFHTVRRVAPDGIITTVAGVGGVSGSDGDGGPATSAHLLRPHALYVEPNGSFVVGDDTGRLRRVSGGVIQTIAGTGTAGYNGDGAALSTQLEIQTAIAHFNGDLAIADYLNSAIRKMPFTTGPVQPWLSIADVSVVEGNSGTKTATFTVSLSQPAAEAVTFNIATSNASATAGSDYVAASLSGQTIAVGQSSKTFAVTINGDVAVEADETFNVTVSTVNGAGVQDGVAVGTITNDDSPPSLSIADVSIAEGNSGTKQLNFTVQLSSPAGTPVSYDIGAFGNTAALDIDFTASSVGQTIAVGQSSATYSVTIIGDTLVEGNETIGVNVTGVFGADVADGQAVGTIIDDDSLPTLSINDVTIAEGNSGTKTATFTISLNQPAAAAVSFDVYTFDQTATAGSDYVAGSVPKTIAVGQSSTTFAVTINGDTTPEGDESFGVAVSNQTNVQIADGLATGLITNDDVASGPSLSIGDVSISEGNSGTKTASFTVSLSAAQSGPVFFDAATANGTATAGSDYVGKTLTGQRIAAGATSKAFTVTINGDTSAEADETFTVNLSNPVNASILDDQATGTITNDDGVSLPTISISDATLVEGNSGSSFMQFQVTMSAPSASLVTFSAATADSSASGGSDYTPQSWGLEFQPGSTTFGLQVPVNGDTTSEGDETFNLNLSNVAGATFADAQGVGTILNDDAAPAATLSIDDVTVVERDLGNADMFFTVRLSEASASNISFNIATSNGTASAGSDYQAKSESNRVIPAGQTEASFNVSWIGDTSIEANETFNVTITNSSGVTITKAVGIGTLLNDDTANPPVMSIGDVSITEGDSGTKMANFVVSLSQASSAAASFEAATFDGSAVAGQDYWWTVKDWSTMTIPAGQTSKVFSVPINGDTSAEPDETFTVGLSMVTGATIGDGTALGTILNDDASAGPNLSINDVSIGEGNSGTKILNFTVSLSAAAASTVSFDVATASGTALANQDYVHMQLLGQTIAAGQTSKTVSVTINGDTTVESDEFFTINVSNVAGAAITDGQGTGTITNDDAASGPTLSINDVTIAEGNSGTKVATFTVTLSAAQTGPVFFDAATSNGTATSGSDYVAKTLTGQRIAAGATSKTFTVTINGDTTSETDETFTVNLSNLQSATIADGQGVGTITNDDAAATPTLSIADASISEGNSGTKTLTFTVSLSPAAAGTVSYDIATVNGSAVAGADFVAAALNGQTISAGQTSKTFAVTINGDTTNEPDENFVVALTNVSGATLGDGTAQGTITNDDSGGGGLTLSIGDVSMSEGNSLTKQMTFTISLSAPAPAKVTFNAATADGTALAGSDYTAKSQTGLAILAGASSKTFVVVIKGDTVAEPNETFLVNVSGVTGGATIADGQAVGTITNDDGTLVRIARVDSRGLYDDLDNGHREPVLTSKEYATLLLDNAKQVCARTNAATVVAVDAVESLAVLRELADATNASCVDTRYEAVMAETAGEGAGFLVESTNAKDVRGVQVLGKPAIDALQVQGSGHAGPITLLTPKALSSNTTERSAQLRALGQSVQAMLKADPQARIVLIGGVTVPGLVDVTARSLPPKSKLPAERVLVSPALLEEFGKTKVEFPAMPANETPAQVLQLQR